MVQDALEIAAIGGKDSMSGTFMDKTVPPTLVSFAVSVIDGENAVSTEFKAAGNNVIFIAAPRDKHEVIDFEILRKNLRALHKATISNKVASAGVIKEGGIAAAVSVMCLGNDLGFEFIKPFNDIDSLFTLQPGGFVVELAEGISPEDLFADIEYINLGHLTTEKLISLNETAAFLWKEAVGKEEISEEELTATLLEAYEVDEETARKDVAQVLAKWGEIGLLA